LALVAHHFGADVLHGHLIDAEDMRLFVKGGIPLAITIHNTRAAWPSGLAGLQPGDASLLIACAQKVEEELATAQLAIPLRTAWNGIDVIENPAQIPLPPPTAPAGEWVLACVANPRRQKRLHLLPAILAATIRELTSRGQPSAVRLILAGEASPKSPEAQDCYRELHEEAIRCGVQNFIEWTDGDRPPTDVYAHAHAAISCSAYEGLSLAHMEALAAGLPLITTDAGGTRELAPGNPAMTLLPVETSPETFASAIVNALTTRGTTGRPAIERDFSSTQLAGRTRWLLQRAADHAAVPIRKGVLFVTNNFSTGGAQSSLRRLAIGLHSQGIPVRIALLQEYEEHPTPGTTALREEGLEMIVLPPAGRTTAPAAVELLLGDLAATPPATVVFWNAIPVYKILIADALWGARIFDVSPGEMFFSSLDRYFANPLPGLPYRSYEDYGRRLSSVIVKFNGEAALARSLFHIPVQVIPNGIAVPESPAEVIPRPPGAPLAFGTSARISLQKRLEDLLEAFRLALSDLPGCTLVIAGAAEQESVAYSRSLQQAATDLPVTWLGEVIGMDAFLRSLDVFVMISEPAGCPNASLEALAIGLPVIATDHGGTKEQVLPGRTGLLVPHRDPRALADAMIDLYRHPEERTRLGAAGRAHVAGQFSLEVMIRRYRELIEQAECPAE
jgi:glycosyltransferase involved in cell wall biosynthesis